MHKQLLSKLHGDILSAPAKAGFWFTMCGFLQRSISLITAPVFTRLMTTEQYGSYSVYLSWYNIIAIFTSLNLYSGVFNNAMLKFEHDRDKYIASMQGLTITLCSCIFIIYIIFHQQWIILTGLSPFITTLMFVELLFAPSLLFWSAHQRFEYKYKFLILITIIKSILNPLLGIIFVVLSKDKATARIISTVIVESAFCIVFMFWQFEKGNAFYIKKFWKYAFFFNLPLIPHYLSGSVLNQGDRIMIERMVGSSEAGIYSVAYNIGILMQIVVVAINSTYTPWFYKALKNKKLKDIQKISNLLLLLMGFGVILLVFVAPELTRIFAPEKYHNAVYVIPPVAASMFFFFLYTYYANIEFFYESKKFVAIASIASAILNIVLNWIFIKRFGYFAAGYTTLVCYIFNCVAHALFARKGYYKNNESNSDYCFDDKTIFLMSLFLMIICIAISFTYKMWYIRWGILIVLNVVAIIYYILNKNKIKNIVSDLK